MMSNKKILVTGGCGFLGSHIVDELLGKKNKVVVVDNLSSGRLQNLNKSSIFYSIDIENFSALEKIFKKYNFNYVFHMAAKINTSIKTENTKDDVNNQILGSLNIINLSVKYKVAKLIYGSSVAIYGHQRKLPVKENAKKDLSNSYSICKATVEHYLEYFNKFYKLQFNSIRYANIYGPRQIEKGEVGVVAIFINNILKKKKINLIGKGLNSRDYIFVKDAAKLTLNTLNNNYSGHINLGSGKYTKTIEIYKILKKINPGIHFRYKPNRINEIKNFCCDVKKMRKYLGNTETNLADGIKKTYMYDKF
jgi:UDP-glucose 4-epimerase